MGYPILADTNHVIAKSYGVLFEDMGIALRGTFVIDNEGIVRHISINDLPTGRDVNETLRTVQALQSGGNTACAWKPGDANL